MDKKQKAIVISLISYTVLFNGLPPWYAPIMEVVDMNRDDFISLLERLDEDGLEIVYLLILLAKGQTDEQVLPPSSHRTS